MLSKTTLKLNKSLCQQAAKCAVEVGYSSVEEFIEHLIQKEVARFEAANSETDVEKKLKGLGYLA